MEDLDRKTGIVFIVYTVQPNPQLSSTVVISGSVIDPRPSVPPSLHRT